MLYVCRMPGSPTTRSGRSSTPRPTGSSWRTRPARSCLANRQTEAAVRVRAGDLLGRSVDDLLPGVVAPGAPGAPHALSRRAADSGDGRRFEPARAQSRRQRVPGRDQLESPRDRRRPPGRGGRPRHHRTGRSGSRGARGARDPRCDARRRVHLRRRHAALHLRRTKAPASRSATAATSSSR